MTTIQKLIVKATLLFNLFDAGLILADPYLDPTTRTNVNKVDPLFRDSVSDFNDYERSIDHMANRGIESASNKQAYKDLAGGKDADAKAGELDKISASDLQARGRLEYAKDPTINGIFVDYSKPGMIRHREDAKRIAEATAKLNDNLFEHLKKLGVNCKSVKGNKIVNPEYFIEIRKITDRNKGDTVYDKYMCEQLRNSYNCSDTVTLKCVRTGLRYGEWQHRTIKLPGHALHNEKAEWGFAVKWKKKRWGWHIAPNHPKGGGEYQIDSPWRNNPELIVADARLYIATKLGVRPEQIREDVGFPPDGRGVEDGSSITPVGCRWRVAWNEYEFTYYYRDTYPVCEVWSEDWSEQCSLK